MIQKICAFCGEPFEPKVPNQTYCKRQHYNICEICGTKYPIKDCRAYPKTCTKKCGAILRKQTCNQIYGGNAPSSSPEIRKKIEQTNYAKYGTKVPMQNNAIKQKAVQTNLDKYGVEWSLQSDVSKEKRIQTNLKRYGTENPMGNSKVRDKFLGTMRKKYGVDYCMQSEEYRKKRSEDYLAKTGYTHQWANPEIQAKSRATWQEKYGQEVSRPLQAKEVQEHLKQTNLDKYGVDNPLKTSKVREKIKKTNLERYGYENVASNPKVRAKMSETNRQRYGKPFYAQTDEARLAVMRNPERLPYLNEFQSNPIEMINKYFPDHKPTLRELMEFTGVSEEPIYVTVNKFGCQDKIAYVYSYMEMEVQQALREIDSDIEICTNVRSIISPYELDIYLPQYKVAIECNPTATHNSSRYAFSHIDTDRQPTPYDYHKMKTDLCEKQGIFLFHIFGYEWKYRKDIIISMLRNILRKNTNKIFARNTYVKEVTATESAEFLLGNHRQGNAQAPIKLGLYVKNTNELVSVMTFGKMRGSMGTSVKEDNSEIWELVRFCNKMNTSVIGGASKLFTMFINKYTPKEIRSFSDRAHTKGALYKTLGFAELRRSSPNYVWVDYKTEIAYHRINAQKHNLKKFLKDNTIDLNQTEREIMESHGYVRVYDSGTITWEWHR